MFALAAIAAPNAVRAQTSLALHASRASTRDATWLYGATVGVAARGFGLRLGGGAGNVSPAIPAGGRDLLWTADADVTLAPTLWGGADPNRAVVPYLFAGAGVQPTATGESLMNAAPHWSWGGGLTIPVVSVVSLMGEVRSRTLFDPAALGAITPDRRATEIRAGLALRFGGGSARRAPTRAPRAPTRPPSRRPSVATVGIPSGPAGSTVPASAIGTEVLPTAQRYLGVNYRYGGASPTTGFDCSGFVQYVFARHDVRLPRTSRQQSMAGVQVEPQLPALRVGDLMFFAERGAAVSHVAVYAGDDRIIHSTSSGGVVRYDDLSSARGQWFATRLVAVRRITSAGAGMSNLVRALEAGTLDAKGVQLDPPDKAPRPR